uniref:CCHC-type domain-containing protein n=1 Tax=Quercus lobata TaxID=97700 RepID=A0A7N2MQT9_QUELO
MDPSILSSLQNLQLTKEEEEAIPISVSHCPGLLEECSLSLFGRLLADWQQNQRALKNTLRSAWKMGSDMRIVEVGNNILQFKFSSKFQMEWVERCGPWCFDNNLLLLCRWKKGLTSTNISFTHSPFWVQIWGLPFEHMSLDVGKEIGSKLGTFLEVDRRSWQSDQAKFMRVRVELEIDKPLRRGAYIVSSEEERLWLTFKYERLPTVCFICGKLGHDKKHCPAARDCENDAQLLTGQGSVSASASLQPSGIVGGKSTLEKCESWGKGNSTCADGNLAGDVQATRGPTELLKSAVTGQAKAQGKGKQILGKGNLKKVARAKGKASDDQTLAQMLKFGAKRWRATEASEEETIRASKRLCKPVNLGPAIDA